VSKNWSLPLEGSAEASKLAALATLPSTDVLSICPACAAAANASAPVLGGRRPGRAQPTDAGPLMLAIGFVLMVFLGCAHACRGYFRALKTTRLEERLEALSSARRAPKPRGSSIGGGAVGVVGGRAVGKSLKAAVGKSLKAARGRPASSLIREAQMDGVSEDEELPLTKPLTAGGESSRERPLEVRSKERCGATAVRAKGAAAGATAALAVTKPAVTKPAVTAVTKPAVTKPAAASGGGSSSGSTSAVSSATKAAPTRCVTPKLKPPPPATVTVPSTSTTPAQSRAPTVTKKAAGTFGGKGAAKLPKAEHPAEQDVISFGKNFGKK
jgi:hypothetical protein